MRKSLLAGRGHAWRACVVATLALTLLLSLVSPAMATELMRISGSDRYGTSIATSQVLWKAGSCTMAIVVTGENWPDALSAGPLAACYNAPVYLVRKYSLPTGLVTEMKRVGVRNVTILGSTAAVGSSVETALRGQGFTITRIYGSDRYATAAAVSHKMQGLAETSSRAFLASGEDYRDAMACSSYAANDRAPILLTRKASIPSSTMVELREHRDIRVVSVLYSSAYAAIPVTKQNYSASDCYSMAFNLWRALSPTMTGPSVGIVTMDSFPDGLSASVAMGIRGNVLVPVRKSYIPTAAANVLKANSPASMLFVFGSTAAISSTTATTAKGFVD